MLVWDLHICSQDYSVDLLNTVHVSMGSESIASCPPSGKMVKSSPAPGKIQYKNALKVRRFFCLLVFKRFKLFFNVRKVRKNQKASCCDEK